MEATHDASTGRSALLRWAAIGLGPAAAACAWWLLPHGGPDGLTPAGCATAAIGLWMAAWWITEAVPLAATALLPVVLFPLLGAAEIGKASAPYASPLVFLFLGGFLIGLAVQASGLHRRLALRVLLAVGTRPSRLVAGFMLATALVSMWISNTATTMMMLPIARSVLDSLRERVAGAGEAPSAAAFVNFGAALMLGVAFAASIGGIATLVGTPPNVILAGFVESRYGTPITMLAWMKVGVPLACIPLPLTWVLLVRVACPFGALTLGGTRELIREELARLGPATRAEWTAGLVLAGTAAAWILQPRLAAVTGIAGLNDTVIAMTGALLLFVLPVRTRPPAFALDWNVARQVPWDILILFGGGLSLAAALGANGVDRYAANAFLAAVDLHPLLFLLLLAAGVTLLSEVASNTAVATMLMPVLGAAALTLGQPHAPLLTAAALAASCGFMLPVATPPNAIVYGSGYVPLRRMIVAGAGLDLIGVCAIAVGIHLGLYPRF